MTEAKSDAETLQPGGTVRIAGVRELIYRVQENPDPVYYRGVSDEAHSRIRRLIRKLSQADPEDFASPPVGDASYRRALRFIAALVPEGVPDHDMPVTVAGMLGGNVSVHQVREILSGRGDVGTRGGETPARLLRQARLLLREGMSQRDVSDELGIARKQITQLATFIGATDAKREVLMDKAIDHVEVDGTVSDFAEANDISRNYAGRVLRETREALSA